MSSDPEIEYVIAFKPSTSVAVTLPMFVVVTWFSSALKVASEVNTGAVSFTF